MEESRKSVESQGRVARLVLTLLALAAAGAGSWEAATRIAREIETRSLRDARAALAAEGQGWARAEADGLVIRLGGTAPDEVARFRALGAVGGRIDDRRIEDRMKIAERGMLEPPAFSLELMRQDDAISLIGLVPARTDREALAARLARGGAGITDLTSTAAFPAPAEWRAALDYGLRAAEILDQATISVTPGKVRIAANAGSPEEKQRLEDELADARPDAVEVVTDISAPLPVIAPYHLRLIRGGDSAVLEDCAADSPETRGRIIAAAAELGVTGAECPLGIGAPQGWGDAAEAAIAALGGFAGGTLDLRDNALRITLPTDTPEDDLTAAGETLAAALPPGFTQDIRRAEAPPDTGPARFTATIRPDAPPRIEGVVPDDTMRMTVQSLARAQLGPVEGELRLDPGLPEGWPLRVMAGLDAMGALDRGDLEVTRQEIGLSGVSGDPFATEKAVLALATRLGAGAEYRLAIVYDSHLDPEIEQPDGTACVDRLNTVMLESRIGFEPGGAGIAGDIGPVLDQMRPIMEDCAAFRIEIAGHTDSRGAADANMRLSLGRARSVLAAMAGAGLPVANMVAEGYGETRPIAENDSAEGREANRRIEMVLISPDPVPAPLPIAPEIAGVTPTAEAAAETLLTAIDDAPVPPTEVPAPVFGTDALAAPPRIEPPAEVHEAMPDTPRPPDRPAAAEGEVPEPSDPAEEEAQ